MKKERPRKCPAPATQPGANTFGCVVDEQVWPPKGYDGTFSYSIYFDPKYRKGTLTIATYRHEAGNGSSRQDIILFSDSLGSIGNYPLTVPNHQEALFYGAKGQCELHQNARHYHPGTLTITRLDLTMGFTAGTFAFTFYKPGCDNVKVTNGRFDKQL